MQYVTLEKGTTTDLHNRKRHATEYMFLAFPKCYRTL